MMHIYYGDGKGKTTAALGLALRWVGRGGKVVIAQFLKGEDSGERVAWKEFPNVTLLPVPETMPFLWNMTPEEREQAAETAQDMLHRSGALTDERTLLVLDELCGAVETGLILEELADRCLNQLPQGAEVVMTGRNPPSKWLEQADYVTELCARKHPYERGIQARKGVEYWKPRTIVFHRSTPPADGTRRRETDRSAPPAPEETGAAHDSPEWASRQRRPGTIPGRRTGLHVLSVPWPILTDRLWGCRGRRWRPFGTPPGRPRRSADRSRRWRSPEHLPDR